jgi:hypothetical protein
MIVNHFPACATRTLEFLKLGEWLARKIAIWEVTQNLLAVSGCHLYIDPAPSAVPQSPENNRNFPIDVNCILQYNHHRLRYEAW